MNALKPAFDEDFTKFREIAEYVLLQDKVGMGDRGTNAVRTFLNAIDGAPRAEGMFAILSLMRFFVEGWREDEKLLSRPVQ